MVVLLDGKQSLRWSTSWTASARARAPFGGGENRAHVIKVTWRCLSLILKYSPFPSCVHPWVSLPAFHTSMINKDPVPQQTRQNLMRIVLAIEHWAGVWLDASTVTESAKCRIRDLAFRSSGTGVTGVFFRCDQKTRAAGLPVLLSHQQR